MGIDNMIKTQTQKTPELYETYHELALQHYHGKTNVRTFRSQLQSLFRQYPQVLETLSVFFQDSPTLNELKTAEADKPAKEDAKQKGTRKMEEAALVDQSKAKQPNKEAAKQEENKKAGLKTVQTMMSSQPTGIVEKQVAPKKPVIIPDELKTLQKNEVYFFLEKVPSWLKNGDATEFFKLLDLYLEGIITKFEFQDMIEPLMLPSEKENIR